MLSSLTTIVRSRGGGNAIRPLDHDSDYFLLLCFWQFCKLNYKGSNSPAVLSPFSTLAPRGHKQWHGSILLVPLVTLTQFTAAFTLSRLAHSFISSFDIVQEQYSCFYDHDSCSYDNSAFYDSASCCCCSSSS